MGYNATGLAVGSSRGLPMVQLTGGCFSGCSFFFSVFDVSCT